MHLSYGLTLFYIGTHFKHKPGNTENNISESATF